MNKAKKLFILTISIIACLAIVVGLTACGPDGNTDANSTCVINFMVNYSNYKTLTYNGVDPVSLPEEPTKDGYKFDGWYLDDGVWETQFTANYLLNNTVGGELYVYAKFIEEGSSDDSDTSGITFKSFTVTGNEVDATVKNNVTEIDFNEEVTVSGDVSYVVYNNSDEVPSKVVSLYEGHNWNIRIKVFKGEEEIATYYVDVYRLKIFTVTFNPNNGEEKIIEYVDEGDTVTMPEEEPTPKDGFVFLRWDEDLTDVPILKDTVVNAQYGFKQYTITYDLDGVEVDNPNADMTTYEWGDYYRFIKISGLISKQKDGRTYEYIFEHWECDGKKIIEIDRDTKGDKVLKAVWYKSTYIYFGEYPQTYVGHETDVDFAGSTKDSRGYYLASNGAYYAQITATPFDGGYLFFRSGHSLTRGVKYQFKVEPIRWRILSEEDGVAFLICDTAIDAVTFDPINLNDYDTSPMRTWLNNDFYNIAFDAEQKEKILTTEVDNSAKSTNPFGKPNFFENGVNYGATDNTFDKVFLLSVEEVTNPNYGFVNDHTTGDRARVRDASEYAMARGIYFNRNCHYSESDYGRAIYWWLRSPVASSAEMRVINGGSLYGTNTKTNMVGVVPAIKIQL